MNLAAIFQVLEHLNDFEMIGYAIFRGHLEFRCKTQKKKHIHLRNLAFLHE